jgi:hypothetical protein
MPADVSKRGVDDGNQKDGNSLQPAKESHGNYSMFSFCLYEQLLSKQRVGVRVSPGAIQIIPYNFMDYFISYFK